MLAQLGVGEADEDEGGARGADRRHDTGDRETREEMVLALGVLRAR